MTASARVELEHSPLFFRRFEAGTVIPVAQKSAVEEILTGRNYEKKSGLYVATTYFSNSPDGQIWQWPQQSASRAEPVDLVVARFRQRFDGTNPAENGIFTLRGGGDLELKHHHSDSKRRIKTSIRIPDEIGIETLIFLSHTDRAAYRRVLENLMQATGENSTNALELVARTHEGLAPLVTRTSFRETHENEAAAPSDGRCSKVKVTVDNGFDYFGFPYWNLDRPAMSAVFLEAKPDLLHVEVKSADRNDETTALLEAFSTMKIGTMVRLDKPFSALREKALKKTKVIVKEQSDHEIEAKLTADLEPGTTVDDALMRIYTAALTGALPEFRICPQFPSIDCRTAESALYSTYGWTDEQNRVHEVVTIIRVEGNPPVYWMKRKGDPQSGGTSTMKRTEKTAPLPEPPDMDNILAEDSQRLGQTVAKIGDFRKRKIAFKVVEVATGRMFTVSLDEDNIENAPDAPSLRQLEIEYAETPRENITLIPPERTIQDSSDRLQNALSGLRIPGVSLTPTSLRKIDWLHEYARKKGLSV